MVLVKARAEALAIEMEPRQLGAWFAVSESPSFRGSGRTQGMSDVRLKSGCLGVEDPRVSSETRRTRRVSRRLLFIAAGAALALAAPGRAYADLGTPDRRGPVHPISFPVVGDVWYADTFGAPRGLSRTHAGQDLMADKMQPLVAVADGTVSWLTRREASYGYIVTISGDDGWTYNYVHLNNDTPGTDDGRASLSDVFGPDINQGARVTAGQLVGFVGDSGNAEDVAPQLHFEMEDPDGNVVNPMASLDAASRLAAPVGSAAVDTVDSLFPRLAGSDRVATALEVSRSGWPDGTAAEVVLAAGDRYAEALPASVLAAQRGGPLLLVSGGALAEELVAELARLGARRVISIGSVPLAVDDALQQRGVDVSRVGVADDTVATAAAIAIVVGATGGRVVVVSGGSFADGVSAATLAAGRGWPVLLSNRDYIPQVSVDAWRALGGPPVTVIGGLGVVGSNIQAFLGADRLAGNDRYGTAAAVVDASLGLGRTLTDVLATTGTAFPDALAAAPLSARRAGVTILVDGSSAAADGAMRAWLAERRHLVGGVQVLGGATAVTPMAERALAATLGRGTR